MKSPRSHGWEKRGGNPCPSSPRRRPGQVSSGPFYRGGSPRLDDEEAVCGESWPWNLGVLVLADGPSTGSGKVKRTVHCVPCPDLFKDSKSRASLKPRKRARQPYLESRS